MNLTRQVGNPIETLPPLDILAHRCPAAAFCALMARQSDHGPERGVRQAVKVAMLRGTKEWAEVQWILKVSHMASMRLMNDTKKLSFDELAVRIWEERLES